MPLGTSILLIAAGAILRYAVTATVSGIDITTVGLILMIVGAIGIALSLTYMLAWSPRRLAFADGRAGVPRLGLRRLLDARRTGALGGRGPRALAAGRIRCRALASEHEGAPHEPRRRVPARDQGGRLRRRRARGPRRG